MTTVPSPDSTDEPEPVLTFDVRETQYCTAVERITTVLGVTVNDALEDADPWHAGDVVVDGTRVRVVDLPRVFGAHARALPGGDERKLVVFEPVDDAGTSSGWLVDAVGGVRSVDRSTLLPARASERFVRGRLEVDGTTTLWLDERAING